MPRKLAPVVYVQVFINTFILSGEGNVIISSKSRQSQLFFIVSEAQQSHPVVIASLQGNPIRRNVFISKRMLHSVRNDTGTRFPHSVQNDTVKMILNC